MKDKYLIWKDTEFVKSVILNSTTIPEVLKKLKQQSSTLAYQYLHTFVVANNFNPQFNKLNRKELTTEDLFCKDSKFGRGSIKRRIFRDGLIPYACKKCNNPGVWQNETISLELEHINGVRNDHRLENLCFLCPNCHSQTSTYCGRNKRKPKSTKLSATEKSIVRNQPLVDKVLNSSIDFNSKGWVNQVAELLTKRPQKIKGWMVKYMPDLYNSGIRIKKVTKMK